MEGTTAEETEKNRKGEMGQKRRTCLPAGRDGAKTAEMERKQFYMNNRGSEASFCCCCFLFSDFGVSTFEF